ncbi:hypothetical protein, partial [Priestia megaterium]|uniref:hypothetical protein n=1 Tax=Priestia megaterium TaxID=1404 RepID=UPI002E1AD3A3|nr:hypothetical protein [Priestia megaterium]
MANYKKVIDENFIKDLHFIKSQLITDPDDWGLFQSQIEVEMKKLDNDYLLHSKAVEFPPFSDFDYRKRYMHSFPEKVKKMRN